MGLSIAELFSYFLKALAKAFAMLLGAGGCWLTLLTAFCWL
jgi:hypothetical protein